MERKVYEVVIKKNDLSYFIDDEGDLVLWIKSENHPKLELGMPGEYITISETDININSAGIDIVI